MAAHDHALVEQVLSKLADRQTLARFLDQPRAVFSELTGGQGDDATLEEVGRRLRDQLAGDGSLSDEQLEKVSGGALGIASLSTLSPRLGSTSFAAGSHHITDVYRGG